MNILYSICRLAILIPIFISGHVHAADAVFGNSIDMGLVESNAITEASGIAASWKNPGILWTHNDSGDSNRIFAMNTAGENIGVFFIEGALERDWEDIAVGFGPTDQESYIYIANIGDNDAVYPLKYIYRIPEPIIDIDSAPVEITLENAEIITFEFPDGMRDAESLIVDPLTKDIYVISKREDNVRVYLASYPQPTDQTIQLAHVATLPFSYATAGDVSPSGTEVLVKNYSTVYFWRRDPGQQLWMAFAQAPQILPYTIEPQGEAISWKVDGSGYFTVSEEYLGIPAHIYFYPRIYPGDIDGIDAVDLKDAVLGLKVIAKIEDVTMVIRPGYPESGADVSGDKKISMEEVLYILQYIAELRE